MSAEPVGPFIEQMLAIATLIFLIRKGRGAKGADGRTSARRAA